MKKLMVMFGLAVAMSAYTSGCMSDKQWSDTKEMHKNMIDQKRTYTAVKVKFANVGGSVTITGVTELAMEAPLNPISTLPQNPEGIKEVADGLVRLGTVAGATYVGHDLATRNTGNTTINNAAAAK